MQNRIRIKSTEGDNRSPVNIFTNRSPDFYRANDLSIEIGVFDRASDLVDAGTLASATLRLITADERGGPASGDGAMLYWEETVTAFEPTLPEQWRDGSKAQLTFVLPPEKTTLTKGSWWVWCVATDTDGRTRTLFAGTFVCRDDGSGSGELPDVEAIRPYRDAAVVAADRAEVAANQIETVAGALLYRDIWSSPAYPEDAAVGNIWVISAPVTIAGVNYVPWDVILYNGTGWQTVPIAAVMTALSGEIDALRAEIALHKQPVGGIYAEQAGGVITNLSINDLAQGGTQSFSLGWIGQAVPSAASHTPALFGSTRGVMGYSPGTAGLGVHAGTGVIYARAENASTTSSPSIASIASAYDKVLACVLTFDASTREAELFINGESQGTADWSNAVLNSNIPLRVMLASAGSGIDLTRSPSGYTFAAAAWDKVLSSDEVNEWGSSGGKIMPLSARASCVLHLACDDGADYQLRDHSGNANHALLTETGVTHLKPSERFSFSWTRVSSGFLGDADRPVLPESSVIESVIWEDAKGTRTTASLGYNASNTTTHVASFTPAQNRQPATLVAGSMAVPDRRLYLHMSANAGAVTVRIKGRIL